MRRAVVLLGVLLLSACGSTGVGDGGGGGPAAGDGDRSGEVRMARASWDTGFMQAEITRQLLEELGLTVSDPAASTRSAATFYPALGQGELDLWVNGWFPLHEPFLDRQLVTGQTITEPIEVVGTQVRAGALQGFLVDRASAERLGITSTDDLADPSVAAEFDQDGDGLADLLGCDDGWGCQLGIDERLAGSDWGANVEQVSGDYAELAAGAVERVEAGEPVLFYTWTPNWTVDVLVPGQDVVWLESSPPDGVEVSTTVEDLEGCATGAPDCTLGWPVNDVRAVANADFLDANPAVRRLLEQVRIPLDDIAEQNARMQAAEEYTDADVRRDAADWIDANREQVDAWLDAARQG